jgi:CRISPR-associated endonuclease/helicase Cas3
MFDLDGYRQFFARLTGKPPYHYQEELANELFAGNSIVLRAPTGSGKTWATLAPFLYGRLTQHPGVAVDRLIYALPLRSLASSLYRSTTEKVEKLTDRAMTVSHCSRNRHYLPTDPFYITLQMGGQQDDPFFEGNLVFTTIDQLLSSYLFAPLSLPERVGNIGAGALIGSLIVFDELHLLDPGRSLATAIEMLDRLSRLSQFVLMTATLPDSVLDWLKQKLAAGSMTLSSQEVLALPSHATKERSFLWVPHPLTSDDVVDNHKERTIAIVNSVRRAQLLFREVRQKVKAVSPAPDVLLLHSRFFPDDRRHWESELEGHFGPTASKSNAILITTQVVEAGIDISADVLMTELAPLNSLIQRAGRVARYGHPRNMGQFLAFELPSNDKGQFELGAYRDQAEIIDATRRILSRQHGPSSLDYLKELEWLNEVHGASDLAALSHLDSLHSHRKQVLRAMDGLDESACSRLIRDISSVSVILTDSPESVSFAGRHWPQLLSVPRMSLFRLREACAAVQDLGWVLKVPEVVEADQSGGLVITWKKCTSPAQAAWLLAIHPTYASYSKRAGLELGQACDSVPALLYTQSPPLPRYSYERESFVTHARRVVNQAHGVVTHHAAMMQALASCHPGMRLLDILDLVCIMHDAGKLQVDWQAEAQGWQRYRDSRTDVETNTLEPLAHTTYDPECDKGDPRLPHFPPHASCGAFSLLGYLGEHFSTEIAITISTVISRHHGAHTKRLQEYELIPEVARVLQECLPATAPRPLCVISRAERADTERFSEDCLLHFSEDEGCWPLYVSLVRILRLADQGSFQERS